MQQNASTIEVLKYNCENKLLLDKAKEINIKRNIFTLGLSASSFLLLEKLIYLEIGIETQYLISLNVPRLKSIYLCHMSLLFYIFIENRSTNPVKICFDTANLCYLSTYMIKYQFLFLFFINSSFCLTYFNIWKIFNKYHYNLHT